MKIQKETIKNPISAYGAGRTFSFSMVFILCAYLLYGVVTALLEKGGNQDFKSSALYILFGYAPISLALFLGIFFSAKSEYFTVKDFTAFKIDKIFIPVIILVWLGSFFGLSGVNTAFVTLLEKLGYTPPTGQLPQKGFWQILGSAVFICIIPAVVEEALFRGVILSGLKVFGKKAAVFISALAFSLYHMSPDKTIYQFIVGAVYAIIALSSKSILPTVIIHFLNNFTVLINWYFVGLDLSFSSGVIFYVFTVLGLLALAGGLFLSFLHAKKDGEDEEKAEKTEENTFKVFLISSAPGFLVCFFIWLANLFA